MSVNDNKSLWQQAASLPEGLTLHNKRVAQTVIIGGGMAGLLTAYFLRKAGHCAIVVEAKTIASGQTGRTTAKITSQHDLIYEKMVREIGFEKARQYAQENEAAIDTYEQIIRREDIDCDFKRLPSYLYCVRDSEREKIRKEAYVARELGICARFLDSEGRMQGGEDLMKEKGFAELPFPVKAAVCFENQAQFHPLKFIEKLAEGLTIYENTKVLKVKGHIIITDKGIIQAKNIVFATHYPISNVPGFYFLRQHQERSYVLALKDVSGVHGRNGLDGMYYGVDENGLSLRSAKDEQGEEVLLLGGGGHRTGAHRIGDHRAGGHKIGDHRVGAGQGKTAGSPEGKGTGYSYLRKMAKLYYPDAEEVAAWAAQDCMPHDKIPFIGKYSVFRPYWYVATGFGKWGMTSAMIAAKHISGEICGKKSKSVFSPQRLYVCAGIKDFLKDVGESMRGLVKGLFAKKEHKCRHMGCKLEWNGEENSWDCPCHGSRFDEKGKLIDNPAQIDLLSKV